MSHFIFDQLDQPHETVEHHMEPTPAFAWLSLPIGLGTLIVAVFGVLDLGTYQNSLRLAVQGQAQDFVTLMLALPFLFVSAVLLWESISWRIVWLGIVMYLAYTYAIAAFQIDFNRFFLLYVMILGCSFYGLLWGFFTIDWSRIGFNRYAPVRVLALLMAFLALAYYGLWLSEVLPALMNGTVPAVVTSDGIPTSAVHVLDMGFFLPLLLIAAWLIWQRNVIGLVIGGMALVFAPIMSIAVMAMLINMLRYDLVDGAAPLIIFSITTVITGGLLVWVLRQIVEKPAQEQAP